jgi:5-methylcytosine-specific restriction endonuclease McrA
MSSLTDRKRRAIRAREEAREIYWGENDRTEHVCQQCGSDASLEVHHQDRDPFNNALSNLIALCHQCHRAEHRAENTEQQLESMRLEFERTFNSDSTNQHTVDEATALGQEDRRR